MLTVDRIEGGVAVCIDSDSGEKYDISLSELPEGIKEGDMVKKADGGYVADRNAAEKRRKAMRNKLDKLFGK